MPLKSSPKRLVTAGVVGKGQPSDRRSRKINFRVSAEELEAIKAGAARVQMPVSDYLRRLGMNYEPPSKVTLTTMREMMLIRAELLAFRQAFEAATASANQAAMPEALRQAANESETIRARIMQSLESL